jgi:hypothetical protein
MGPRSPEAGIFSLKTEAYKWNSVATRPTISLKNNKFLTPNSKRLKNFLIDKNFPHSICAICSFSLFSAGKQVRMMLHHPPFAREPNNWASCEMLGTCERFGQGLL